MTHPVRLEEERELQGARRHVLPVVRPVFRGRAVVVAARGLEEPVEFARLHVLRALEHDVLEEVGKPRAPRLLPGRTDVIPGVDANEGDRVVLMEDHVQTVGQRKLRVRHLEPSLRLPARRSHREHEPGHHEIENQELLRRPHEKPPNARVSSR